MVGFKNGDSQDCSVDNLCWLKVTDPRRNVMEGFSGLPQE